MRRMPATAGIATVIAMFVACSSDDAPGPSKQPGTPVLVVTEFDVAEAGWGDAPVSVHFTWSIDSSSTKPLTCKLDFDGDGTFDLEVADCKKNTLAEVPANLPVHTYDVPGKHVPKLVVTDGKLSAEATQKIFANKLQFAKNVVFPEKLPGFVKAEATPNTQVVLTFATAAQVPSIKGGDLIWGTSGSGYLIKATTATKSGAAVTVDGIQGKITDGIENGFFGARDVVSTYADARCVEGDCAGATFEHLPPGGPGIEPATAGKSQQALKIQGAGSWGLKVALPSPGKNFEHSLFAGVVINEFLLETSFFTLKNFNIEVGPTFQYDWAVKGDFSKTFLLGTISLGAIPLGPIVITPMLFPSLTLAVSLKVGASTQIGLPLRVSYAEGSGWTAGFKPFVHPALKDYVNPAETVGVSVGAEVKFSPYVNFLILGAVGPFMGPNVGVGVEAKVAKTPPEDYAICKSPVQACLSAKISAGGEYGVDCPWVDDANVKLSFTLAEWEFYKACTGKPDDAGLCGPPIDGSAPPPDAAPDVSVSDAGSDVVDTGAQDTSTGDADTGAEEYCDGIDNSGEGTIDEGCPTGFNHLDLAGTSPNWGYTGTPDVSGGTAFTLLCPFPQAMIGVCGRYDSKNVTALGSMCSGITLVTNTSVTPYEYSVGLPAQPPGDCSPTSMAGASTGGTVFNFKCPTGQMVHRVLGTHGTTSTDRIGQIQLECVKLGFVRSTGNVWTVVKASTTLSPSYGPGPGLPFDWTPPDTAAGMPAFLRTLDGRYQTGGGGIYRLSTQGRSFKNLLVK